MSIIIWELTFTSKEYPDISDSYYFLFKRSAHRFLKNNEDMLERYNYILGGVHMWLW